MAYSDLSVELQNLILVNAELYIKLFILGFLFFGSLFYIFFLHPKITNTKLLFVDYFLNLLKYLSWLYISMFFFIMPLVLYPQFDINILLILMYSVAGIITFILFGLFTINIFYYPPQILLKLAGVKIKDTNSNYWYKKVTKKND